MAATVQHQCDGDWVHVGLLCLHYSFFHRVHCVQGHAGESWDHQKDRFVALIIWTIIMNYYTPMINHMTDNDMFNREWMIYNYLTNE